MTERYPPREFTHETEGMRRGR